MESRLSTSIRVVIGVVLTAVLWWIGVRHLGVSLVFKEGEAAVYTFLWMVITGMIWLLLVGQSLIGRVGELAGGMGSQSERSYRVDPEYSVAEARFKQGRYQEAIEAFRQDIRKHPKEVTPHMRIAEILVDHLGDPSGAVAELRGAMRKARDEESFALVIHRMADIYVRNLGDTAAAIECLTEIQHRYPKSPRAKAAMERVEHLSGR